MLIFALKGGYTDTGGSGTLKIITACFEAELTKPEILEQDGGILVTLFKDRYTKDQLRKMRLNDRQVKAVLCVVGKGSLRNEYQKLTDTSKTTATTDLRELEANGILTNKGTKGSSSKYGVESRVGS